MTAASLTARAALVSLIVTTLVVAVKLTAAYFSGAISVWAEGIQSTMDILMSALSLWAVRYAAKPPDETHHYGHAKAELLTSALQMLVILSSGFFLLYQSYLRLLRPEPIRWDLGAGAMLISLVANGLVILYIRNTLAKVDSPALKGEELHLRGDSLGSLGVLVGMILVGLTGNSLFDPLAAVGFILVAMFAAGKNLQKLVHPLMDGALPIEEVEKLKAVLDQHREVRGYHDLRTRKHGDQKIAEFHLMLDDQLSFVRAHELAEEIEAEVSKAIGGGVVTVHYEPYEAELLHRAREH